MFKDLRLAFRQLLYASLVKLGWLGLKERGPVVMEVVIVFCGGCQQGGVGETGTGGNLMVLSLVGTLDFPLQRFPSELDLVLHRLRDM